MERQNQIYLYDIDYIAVHMMGQTPVAKETVLNGNLYQDAPERAWEELRETLHGYGVGVYAVWTRRLLYDHEIGVVRHALTWLLYYQLPRLWQSVRGAPDSAPVDLLMAEARGCLAGPRAYRTSRRRLRAAEPA